MICRSINTKRAPLFTSYGLSAFSPVATVTLTSQWCLSMTAEIRRGCGVVDSMTWFCLFSVLFFFLSLLNVSVCSICQILIHVKGIVHSDESLCLHICHHVSDCQHTQAVWIKCLKSQSHKVLFLAKTKFFTSVYHQKPWVLQRKH